jgi:nucleotide-binding universal stress UspA family protein
MFRRIVVGVDEQAGGRDAIALAETLLAPDGELTLAHVYAGNPTIARVATPSYDVAEREHALRLLEGAREQAKIEASLQCVAKLSAFTVVSVPLSALGPPLPLSTTINKLVSDARDRIAAIGGVEAHAAYGETADELALYSASLDLLIVGSRGYGPVGRLTHGSTSHRLACLARCPLLVLPRAAQLLERSEATQ